MKWKALGFDVPRPTELYVDNTAMMSIAEDWKLSDRTRHIDIRFHHIRIGVVEGNRIIKKVHTDYNTSDMMTKGLDLKKQDIHCSKLMAGVDHPDYVPKSRRRSSRYFPGKDGSEHAIEEAEG
jgi:hypothetical protein